MLSKLGSTGCAAGVCAWLLVCLLNAAPGRAQAPASEARPLLSTNTPCRMTPKLDTCGLPVHLANFQVRARNLWLSCAAWCSSS